MTNQQKQFTSAISLILLLTGGLAAISWLQTGSERTAPTPEEVRQGAPSADVLPAAGEPGEALFGYDPHPEEQREFLRSLPKPTIREAGPGLFQAIGDPQEVLLYRALYKAYEKKYGNAWVVGRQGIGDCVSFGWAHGADIHLAIMYLRGDSADFKLVATESIYGGSRVEARGVRTGGWSDGSYGAAAAKWVREWGLVFRDEYDGVDLTTYSSRRAKDWGYYGNGGQGDHGKLDNEAKKHPVRDVALVTNFDEAAAAIASGYPVPVCSGQGFTSRRDADGFARAAGSWPHCMCFIGVRHGDRPGLLCLNSWGPSWIDGPKYPDDMPDGSFWVDRNTVNRMLAGRDSYCVSGYGGFPFQEINHADWVLADPVGDTETHFALVP
ncbi:hypothetical protein [Bremerella cremea]|uniref:hypothetical protein n=1 Tax=Bremerella cremea TaxID=1031537 RepID=UPI0031E885E5